MKIKDLLIILIKNKEKNLIKFIFYYNLIEIQWFLCYIMNED